MTQVDLIIPTHNGADLLLACLASLKHSTFQAFTLTVFDDDSRVPVEAAVLRAWPSATVLRSEHNIGLVAAFNAAIDAGSSPYVVLLNDDTEVHPDWLGELVACAERNSGVGSVASKMLLYAARHQIHSAGDYFSVRGMPGNRGVWLADLGQFDNETRAFSACGGAALYRRAALAAVRLPNGDVFDRRLFMYCEDVDLGWRLQTAGFPCAFAPKAVVYHHLSATGGGTLASYHVARNVWLVLARSVPRGVLRPYRARIIAHHSGRIYRMLRHVREPAARASLRGTIVGLTLALLTRHTTQPLEDSEIERLRALLHDNPAPFDGL